MSLSKLLPVHAATVLLAHLQGQRAGQRARTKVRKRITSMDLPDDFYVRLMTLRGGCACGNPGMTPPCPACETPMTDQEANAILSSLADELPVTEVLRIQTVLIENDYDGTIK